VKACLAFLTLPEEPLPIVFPSRHGPTCVFRLDFPDVFVDVFDICESRCEWRLSSLEIADMRLSSAWGMGELGWLRICRLPPGAREPWWGILGGDDLYGSELACSVDDCLLPQLVESPRGWRRRVWALSGRDGGSIATASGNGGWIAGPPAYDAYMLFRVSNAVTASPECFVRGEDMIAMMEKA